MSVKNRLSSVVLPVVCLFVLTTSALAKDTWIQVRSKNFNLIGNASEKDIRGVASRLEQFREAFRLLFNNAKLEASIPMNVVVFKSDSSFKNFKPRRADGKVDTFVAGVFWRGEDVNYITLSVEDQKDDTFETIFHEFVHSIVNATLGKAEVPAWFNEGLAEFYSTFQIADDDKVKLGLPIARHILLLQQAKFIPLDQLFAMTNYQWLQSGDHSRSICYAESWALIHYLIQGGKADQLNKFLTETLAGTDRAKAFSDAFQMDYKQMEKALRDYVSKSSYKYNLVTFHNKLNFDADMRATPISEASADAYLGDLLYHSGRAADAEPFLNSALAAEPAQSMANTTLGMVKVEERKFDEAKDYLAKGIAGDPKNHLAYYEYARLLSREGQDEFGMVHQFPPATAASIREALKKAITLAPDFTESYEMLAFVDIVNNENLDDAAAAMKIALRYQPGNDGYALRLAEIYARQKKFDEALATAGRIGENTDDQALKSRAQALKQEIGQLKSYESMVADQQARRQKAVIGVNSEGTVSIGSGPPPPMQRRSAPEPVNIEEAKKRQEEEQNLAINIGLRKPAAGEKRTPGLIQTINCKTRPIQYSVEIPDGSLTLTSTDFQSIVLNAFDPSASQVEFGCDAKISEMPALITYKPTADAAHGELVAIEFVPSTFKLLSDDEIKKGSADGRLYRRVDTPPPSESGTATVSDTGPTETPSDADLNARRHDAMVNGVKNALKKPVDGQKRLVGTLEKMECSSKGAVFVFKTKDGIVKLTDLVQGSPKIGVYTPDLEGIRFGCGVGPLDYPASVIYTDKPNEKSKTAGDIVSIEFVPKTFVLD